MGSKYMKAKKKMTKNGKKRKSKGKVVKIVPLTPEQIREADAIVSVMNELNEEAALKQELAQQAKEEGKSTWFSSFMAIFGFKRK